MPENNNTFKYRVTRLEDAQEKIEKSLDKLLVNDIPHITTELVRLKTRIDILTTVNVGAVVFATVINLFLK